jgi:hypothetical protein
MQPDSEVGLNFADALNGSAVYVAIRRFGENFALAVSSQNEGDTEVVLNRGDAQKVLQALADHLK